MPSGSVCLHKEWLALASTSSSRLFDFLFMPRTASFGRGPNGSDSRAVFQVLSPLCSFGPPPSCVFVVCVCVFACFSVTRWACARLLLSRAWQRSKAIRRRRPRSARPPPPLYSSTRTINLQLTPSCPNCNLPTTSRHVRPTALAKVYRCSKNRPYMCILSLTTAAISTCALRTALYENRRRTLRIPREPKFGVDENSSSSATSRQKLTSFAVPNFACRVKSNRFRCRRHPGRGPGRDGSHPGRHDANEIRRLTPSPNLNTAQIILAGPSHEVRCSVGSDARWLRVR